MPREPLARSSGVPLIGARSIGARSSRAPAFETVVGWWRECRASRCLHLLLMLPFLLIGGYPLPVWGDESLRREAAEALRRGVAFYRDQVASHGGYVYRYSHDLAKREAEGKTGPDTVWVQPPGTPAVGAALLDAYERTGESYLLDAARAAGECLRQGQLVSGGWTDRIEFDPAQRRRFTYRTEERHEQRSFNVTTFDDDKTQSALRLLMRLDQTLEFRDAPLHEAATYALDAVLRAQFPHGGWPQGFDTFPDPTEHSVRQATFPEQWSREYPGGAYWRYPTFNDNSLADTIDMLLLASQIYRDERYRAAARRGGDFILLAQLPDPQPAWAQQYNFQLQPAWARKFEPPAISGGESQGIIRILLRLYEESGERKYLEPIPRALAYLKKSEIAPGKLARFYELRTNRPLYFTRDYQLTYDDRDLPTHYSFQVSHRLDELQRRYDELAPLDEQQLAERRAAGARRRDERPNDERVRAVIQALDERGAWVTEGRLRYHGAQDDTRQIIDSSHFCRQVEVLSRYLAR